MILHIRNNYTHLAFSTIFLSHDPSVEDSRIARDAYTLLCERDKLIIIQVTYLHINNDDNNNAKTSWPITKRHYTLYYRRFIILLFNLYEIKTVQSSHCAVYNNNIIYLYRCTKTVVKYDTLLFISRAKSMYEFSIIYILCESEGRQNLQKRFVTTRAVQYKST